METGNIKFKTASSEIFNIFGKKSEEIKGWFRFACEKLNPSHLQAHPLWDHPCSYAIPLIENKLTVSSKWLPASALAQMQWVSWSGLTLRLNLHSSRDPPLVCPSEFPLQGLSPGVSGMWRTHQVLSPSTRHLVSSSSFAQFSLFRLRDINIASVNLQAQPQRQLAFESTLGFISCLHRFAFFFIVIPKHHSV